jgi:hypothetical protein
MMVSKGESLALTTKGCGMSSLKIKKEFHFSKVGVDEIEGLKPLMLELMRPLQAKVKEHVYWNDCALTEAPYKSCDGFIPHSYNCGGIQLDLVIPKCEEYEFSFLEFGECDDAECIANHEHHCSYEDEGHLDAGLSVWFKFEGYNQETGELKFYLVLSGGNSDAPYFRSMPTIFETEFTAKTLAGVRLFGERAIKKLINATFNGFRS